MNSMTRAELDGAVSTGIMSAEQADRLAAYLGATAETDERARFSFVHVLYYLGGMIAIGAMSLFMTLGWNALGGWGGCVTAILYGVLALLLSHWFLEQKQLYIPAGIMATLAVVMVPLAIFAAQMALGYWGENKPYRDFHVFIGWRWLMMEFGTLALGAILLWRYRFPLMLMPKVRFRILRLAHDAARVLGGFALARLAGLRILAVPFRRADVLVRAVAHELGQRAE